MPCLSRLSGAALSLCVAAVCLGGLSAAPIAQPRLDVPYVPTPQEVVDRMLALGKIRAGEFHMDLGSGDGRIAVTAAAKFGARAFGVDLNPVRVNEARENAKKANVGHLATFEVRNLYQTDISKADIVTMYLLPSVNLDLRPRVLSEMSPGTRIVSHAFDMGDWEPDVKESVSGRSVYLWTVPARVQGKWSIDGSHKFTVELQQTYQKLAGSAEIGGKSQLLRDASLEGAEIGFTVEIEGLPYRFHGTVNGDRIDGRRNEWRGSRAK
jgi:Ribosomal protein L11 methyltransferase (PrmA)